MYFRLLFFGLCTLFISCSDTIELSVRPEFAPEDGKELVVSVNNQPISKARVESTYFPSGSEIGVFLRSMDGSYYDGVGYNNAKFTASGEETSQTWEVNASDAIRLNTKIGKAYAYYPWTASATADLKIPITNDGTDWMYATEAANDLSSTNNVAQFTMAHAMTLIKCKVVKGNYFDNGEISSVSVSGPGLGSNGFMDLSQAKVTDVTDAGAEIVTSVTGQMGSEPFEQTIWAVPSGVFGALKFKVTVDGTPYVASSIECELLSGQVYVYTLTVNSQGLDVSSVSVKDWENADQGTEEPVFTDAWETQRSIDGVYAIDDYGRPVAYEDATADSYAGVAFVVKGKVYQVAKTNALGSNGTDIVYNWKTGYFDIGAIKNYLYLDGELTGGYLDGVTAPQMPNDPSQWAAGALSDFEGAQNTEAIIAAQTVDGVVQDETLGKAVVSFRENLNLNEGYDDWFAPSCGEYAFMYLHRAALNELLEKAGGVGLVDHYYWTSSERDSNKGWCIDFTKGELSNTTKYNTACIRFVKHL